MDKINDQNLTLKAIKIALLGDSTVGKTEIINSYLGREFTGREIQTIGCDKCEKKFTLKNEKTIKLTLWDTAGAEAFRSVPLQLLRNFQGVILVFDITNKSSFNNLNKWLKDIKERSSFIPIILFGNKVDKIKEEWEVTSEEAKNFAEKIELIYFEVSAKTKQGINEGISYIANNIYEKYEEEKNPHLKINNQVNDDGSKCVGKGKSNKRKSK